MRVLPASATALLVELQDLDATTALLAALQRQPLQGVRELVPGARTLMIAFDPEQLTRATLLDHLHDLAQQPLAAADAGDAPLIEIPVHYDGEDLADVAALLDLSTQEVVRRHTGTDWLVAFTGFAPGFAYLTGGDALLREIPRRSSPRTRIPPGAVAVAGGFSGVYPKASPGGWQLLGQTFTPMWDLTRQPPALLQPGQRVRFVDAGPRPAGLAAPMTGTGTQSVTAAAAAPATTPERAEGGPTQQALPDDGVVAASVEPKRHGIELLQPGLQALLQDLGRPGRAGQGVAASGAMDRGSLREANRLVGNAVGTACIEHVQGGLELRCHGPQVLAVAGASGPVTLQSADGRYWTVPRHAPLALNDGDRLRLGEPTAGLRSYVAVRGGFDRPPVLDSLAFDTLAEVGPPPLRAGDWLGVRPMQTAQTVGAPTFAPDWPCAGDEVALDLLPGPRMDWFTNEAVALLTQQRWTVTPQSNRVGIRLAGEQPLRRAVTTELPSEGTPLGALQVPANGQPVLFLADHPLTGGYPVIACLAPWHLDLAGQLPVGTQLRFRLLAPFEPVDLATRLPPRPNVHSDDTP